MPPPPVTHLPSRHPQAYASTDPSQHEALGHRPTFTLVMQHNLAGESDTHATEPPLATASTQAAAAAAAAAAVAVPWPRRHPRLHVSDLEKRQINWLFNMGTRHGWPFVDMTNFIRRHLCQIGELSNACLRKYHERYQANPGAYQNEEMPPEIPAGHDWQRRRDTAPYHRQFVMLQALFDANKPMNAEAFCDLAVHTLYRLNRSQARHWYNSTFRDGRDFHPSISTPMRPSLFRSETTACNDPESPPVVDEPADKIAEEIAHEIADECGDVLPMTAANPHAGRRKAYMPMKIIRVDASHDASVANRVDTQGSPLPNRHPVRICAGDDDGSDYDDYMQVDTESSGRWPSSHGPSTLVGAPLI